MIIKEIARKKKEREGEREERRKREWEGWTEKRNEREKDTRRHTKRNPPNEYQIRQF